ncbi:MAG: 30S ribosomal protein S21 [bacterium]
MITDTELYMGGINIGVCKKGVIELPGIVVRDSESLDSALKRFKRECQESGILSEMKRREHYEKPSDKRRRLLARRKKKF